jgi:hypothetical protein
LRIIESSICVAVITGTPASFAASISCFWTTGTCSRHLDPQIATRDHDRVGNLDRGQLVPSGLSILQRHRVFAGRRDMLLDLLDMAARRTADRP